MTRPAATAAETDFHERMHAAHMYGLWELASQMTRHPEPKAIPYMWKAFVLDAMVREAGEAVPVGEERRALQLFNPGLDGRDRKSTRLNSSHVRISYAVFCLKKKKKTKKSNRILS